MFKYIKKILFRTEYENIDYLIKRNKILTRDIYAIIDGDITTKQSYIVAREMKNNMEYSILFGEKSIKHNMRSIQQMIKE